MAEELHLVIFRIGAELFGVPISSVQEIIRVPAITHIPQSPNFIEGVINLRGRIITVMDLHKRLGHSGHRDCAHEGGTGNRKCRILVIELDGVVVGVMVDEVVEILKLSLKLIEPASALIARSNEQYIGGVGKLDERLFILLDIRNLLTLEQQSTLDDLAPLMA